MHIVHVADYFHPLLGYQESVLARTHARQGHRVTVVTSNRHFPHPDYDRVYRPLLGPRIVTPGQEEQDGLTILRLRPLLDTAGFVLLPQIPGLLCRLKPDLVIHHGLLHPNFWLTAWAKRRGQWPLTADSHMAVYNTNARSPAVRLYLGLYRALLGRFVRRSVRAIAIGPCEKEFLQSALPGVDVELIPLGADPVRFQPSSARRTKAREALGLLPGDMVLVHAGKMQPEKLTCELILAYKQLQPRYPNLRLLLVGDASGDYRQRLDEALEGVAGVVRRPLVKNEELPDILAAADLGIWPGSPSMVFIEAMAMGLPLVLQAGIYAEFLLQNGNGAMVAGSEDLAQVVAGFLDDPERMRKAGKKSRQRFESQFNSDRIGEEFIQRPHQNDDPPYSATPKPR